MAGRKKVILFLVEGESELDALVAPFRRYFKERAQVEDEAFPYRVFFMSRNLEHALFGISVDADDDMKERLSRAFAEECRKNPRRFEGLLRNPEVCVPGTYEETWGYIQEGVHSLERGTNLGLLLDAEVA